MVLGGVLIQLKTSLSHTRAHIHTRTHTDQIVFQIPHIYAFRGCIIDHRHAARPTLAQTRRLKYRCDVTTV